MSTSLIGTSFYMEGSSAPVCGESWRLVCYVPVRLRTPAKGIDLYYVNSKDRFRHRKFLLRWYILSIQTIH